MYFLYCVIFLFLQICREIWPFFSYPLFGVNDGIKIAGGNTTHKPKHPFKKVFEQVEAISPIKVLSDDPVLA